ncbi:MAG: glycerol-3-phosphate 1-O-acyltransferase PlsY [Kiritimatiellia bacterium]
MSGETVTVYVVFAVAAYLCGAIPFGFLIGKLRGIDVRTVGSKNIGATNVYRTVGHKWGFLAFFCDFLKGFVPTLLARLLFPDTPHLAIMTGVLCVCGHMWTCFMKFKGGKGIATGFGMLVALIPWMVLTAFGIFAATVWISHYISLGSILAAAFLLVAVWFPILGSPGVSADCPQCVLVAAVAAFAIWRHRSNIGRLARGCENKIY